MFFDLAPHANVTVTRLEDYGAAAMWAYIVENSKTALHYIRVIKSAVVAKLSGAATTTITMRDDADTKDRITATVDAEIVDAPPGLVADTVAVAPDTNAPPSSSVRDVPDTVARWMAALAPDALNRNGCSGGSRGRSTPGRSEHRHIILPRAG